MGEKDRRMVRDTINNREICNLQHNLNQTVGLIDWVKQQLDHEIDSIRHEGARARVDMKSNYEYRLSNIRDDFERSKNFQK